MNQRHAIRAGISLGLLLLFGLYVRDDLALPLVDRLEDFAYDARVRLTTLDSVDPRVVIVDIDERSLSAEGHWPWPRDLLGRLVRTLVDRYGVRVVGVDYVFPEPDDQRALAALDALAGGELADDARFRAAYDSLRPALDTDARFAADLVGRPVVLGFVLQPVGSGGEGQALGALPPPLIAAGAGDTALRFEGASGATGNLAALQRAARGGGFFSNPLVDEDGSFRRVTLLQEYRGAVYESLALATLRHAYGDPPPPVGFEFFSGSGSARDNLDLEWLTLGGLRLPVDEQLAIWIPYRGGQGSFRYVSATDVLAGTVDQATLRDSIVLVGTTAPGLLDLRTTPVGNAYPGVEVHANLISGILDQRVKQRPEYVRGAHLLLLVLCATLLTIANLRLGVGGTTVATLALLAATIASNLAAWEAGMIMPLASPVAFVVLLWFAHTLYGLFFETRRARKIGSQFGQYVPPELVKEMDERGEEFTFEGQARDMTVLFSDVRDFTSISEGLAERELSNLMNAYLTPMTEAIHAQRGTIDKYIGDAIMAFWGAPLADPEHARHAVLTALAMDALAAKLRTEFPARGWPEIHIGVGLSSGLMRVGDMGSRFRRQYTVMGDNVNLGARLEGLTKTYGVTVLASAATVEQVPEVQFVELDLVRVKGKERPVAIHTPLGLRDALDRERRAEATRHRAALEAFRAQRWDEAERDFFALDQARPRAYYRLFLDRIAHFRHHPPAADWDGAATYTSK